MKHGIKLITIGDTEKLPHATQKQLEKTIIKTKENRNLTLTLALSYSGKWDILNAVKKIIVEKKNPDKISEDIFKQYLATKNVPEPELLIRTSGEFRISNFLLWQIAYTELYFSKILWPDFSRKDFLEAIIEYQNRERRFGKTKEQIEC